MRSVFESVAFELGGGLVGFEQLTGGVSATVYALDLRVEGEPQRVVYRQYPEHDFKGHEPDSVAVEFGVLESLHAAGFAVAKPLLLKTVDQFLVTEYVEGSTDVSADALDSALDQMADFLLALHAFDPAALRVELTELEDLLTSSLTYLPDTDAGRQARKAIDEHSLRPNQSVVIHGDYWPGNMLWHKERLAAVIDWEDTRIGDPLADLASARVELLCQYGPSAMDYFTDRYLAQTNLHIDSLPVWEMYVSSAALATMHLWGLDAAEENRRRTQTTPFFERAVARAQA